MTRQANSCTDRGTGVPAANRILESPGAPAKPARPHSIEMRPTIRRTTSPTRLRVVARERISDTAMAGRPGSSQRESSSVTGRAFRRLDAAGIPPTVSIGHPGTGQRGARAEVGGLRRVVAVEEERGVRAELLVDPRVGVAHAPERHPGEAGRSGAGGDRVVVHVSLAGEGIAPADSADPDVHLRDPDLETEC